MKEFGLIALACVLAAICIVLVLNATILLPTPKYIVLFAPNGRVVGTFTTRDRVKTTDRGVEFTSTGGNVVSYNGVWLVSDEQLEIDME